MAQRLARSSINVSSSCSRRSGFGPCHRMTLPIRAVTPARRWNAMVLTTRAQSGRGSWAVCRSVAAGSWRRSSIESCGPRAFSQADAQPSASCGTGPHFRSRGWRRTVYARRHAIPGVVARRTHAPRTPAQCLSCRVAANALDYRSFRHAFSQGRPMPPLRATKSLDTIEGARLHSTDCSRWQRWGPYLSERQWGTVREDYSENGTAWDYFPHDHARSSAYRWGEDGIMGISDLHGMLCFAVALWNGKDPILKER